jgi:hypothetical protein
MIRQEMLLVQLMEEAAEVVQGISKCLRFGTNHEWPAGERTAEYRLIQELIDLMALVEMCQEEGMVGPWPTELRSFIECKKQKVEKYMAMSIELGKVS